MRNLLSTLVLCSLPLAGCSDQPACPSTQESIRFIGNFVYIDGFSPSRGIRVEGDADNPCLATFIEEEDLDRSEILVDFSHLNPESLRVEEFNAAPARSSSEIMIPRVYVRTTDGEKRIEVKVRGLTGHFLERTIGRPRNPSEEPMLTNELYLYPFKKEDSPKVGAAVACAIRTCGGKTDLF
ncbi:MAG: hypothetical protein GY856_48390 [bacterium]|nr:hypothetical protein [bacterium]